MSEVLTYWINRKTGSHWCLVETKETDPRWYWSWENSEGRRINVRLLSANLRKTVEGVELIDTRWDFSPTEFEYSSDGALEEGVAVVRRFGLSLIG